MRISKYNANGNDFVIFHTFDSANRSELARRLCDRHAGIGADGMIVLIPRQNGLLWEFYNNDGSIAEMCGNGSRAAIAYAYDNALCGNSTSLLTISGEISARVISSGGPTLAGNPSLEVEVMLTKPTLLADKFIQHGREWVKIDTGVPHLVSFGDDISEFDLVMAKQMRQEHNANVNLALVRDKKLYVRTYERGVEDETMACGTGMAACFYAAHLSGALGDSVAVYPKSGDELGLRLQSGSIYFKGFVNHSFDTFVAI